MPEDKKQVAKQKYSSGDSSYGKAFNIPKNLNAQSLSEFSQELKCRGGSPVLESLARRISDMGKSQSVYVKMVIAVETDFVRVIPRSGKWYNFSTFLMLVDCGVNVPSPFVV